MCVSCRTLLVFSKVRKLLSREKARNKEHKTRSKKHIVNQAVIANISIWIESLILRETNFYRTSFLIHLLLTELFVPRIRSNDRFFLHHLSSESQLFQHTIILG